MNFSKIANAAKNAVGDKVNQAQKAGSMLGGLKNPALQKVAELKMQAKGYAGEQANKLVNGKPLQGLGKTLEGGLAGKPQAAMNAAKNAAQGAAKGASQMASNLAQKPQDIQRGIVSGASKLAGMGKGLAKGLF